MYIKVIFRPLLAKFIIYLHSYFLYHISLKISYYFNYVTSFKHFILDL